MKSRLKKFSTLSIFVFYFTNLIGLATIKPVFADQRTYHCEYYQPRSSQDVYHGEGGPIRCLVDRGPGQNAWITIENTSDVTVIMGYGEWHSTCGLNGELVTQQQGIRLEPGEQKDITLQPPGTGVTCREAFVHNCMSVRSETGKCHDVVRVTWTTRD